MHIRKSLLTALIFSLTPFCFAQEGPPAGHSTGILLLAHGGANNWNEEVAKIASEVGKAEPIEVAFGMASRRSIQDAIDRLVKRGVREIVAVPLFVSSHSSVVVATQYLLGLRPEAPPEMERYARMSHDHGAHSAAGDHGSSPDAAKPIQSPVPIRMTAALDAHPLVAEILASRARSISQDPSHEAVVLVAHGPVTDDENAQWLSNMAELARAMEGASNFHHIRYLTVRDDAPEPIRARATAELRAEVEDATRQGDRVLIVPLLISYGGIEPGIRKRLEGLKYTMSPQALLPDERMVRWVVLAVQGASSPVVAATEPNTAGEGSLQSPKPGTVLKAARDVRDRWGQEFPRPAQPVPGF